MKTISIEMPQVSECSVTECAYNVERGCRARAITVGDGVNPGCDTYFSASRHTNDGRRAAGVGACKVSICQHNQDFECGADAIQVSMAGPEAKCMTFARR